MNIISTTIERDRGGRMVKYEYRTYDIVLNPPKGMKPNFYKLCEYLSKVYHYGVPEQGGSPSQAPEIFADAEQLQGTTFSALAKQAGYDGAGFRQHEIVQNHFHAHCEYCIATEVPVYDDHMTGCIDILLYVPEEDRLIVLDFKPDSHKEKKAATQVKYYRKILAERTGIVLTRIDAAYFDKNYLYQIKHL